jgi:hypothetical protein
MRPWVETLGRRLLSPSADTASRPEMLSFYRGLLRSSSFASGYPRMGLGPLRLGGEIAPRQAPSDTPIVLPG